MNLWQNFFQTLHASKLAKGLVKTDCRSTSPRVSNSLNQGLTFNNFLEMLVLVARNKTLGTTELTGFSCIITEP